MSVLISFPSLSVPLTHFLFLLSTLLTCSSGWYPWHRCMRGFTFDVDAGSEDHECEEALQAAGWFDTRRGQKPTDGNLELLLAEKLQRYSEA